MRWLRPEYSIGSLTCFSGHSMIGKPLALSLTVAVAAFVGSALAAAAQSAGSIEAVNPNGVASQKVTLTPAQEHTIYDAVAKQRVRPLNGHMPVAVGAPVPETLELADLPDQAATAEPSGTLLKYAMVEDKVVVVDPVRMRVVAVIRDGVEP
jgi:hypothetical protein